MQTRATDPTIYLTDRTAEETDELCGMKYWWHNCEGERGIVPRDSAIYLEVGGAIHTDMEQVARGTPIEEILDSIPLPEGNDQPELERTSRRRGWVAAWSEYVEPRIREGFEEVSCEEELVLDRTPLWIGVVPDRIQRRIATGGLVYREYKSTISTSKAWQEHWMYAIQLQLGLAALQEEYPHERVEYGQVSGFYKGVERDGRLAHPYVWAYYRNGQWSASFKPGWDHCPVWEYPGGTLAWVRLCGAEVAERQFAFSAPVTLDWRRVDDWTTTRLHRRGIIERAREGARTDRVIRLQAFPPSAIHCRPSFGPQCPYLAACHNFTVQADPVGSGLYIPRTPHHDLELIGASE